jgi:hypothetical protein
MTIPPPGTWSEAMKNTDMLTLMRLLEANQGLEWRTIALTGDAALDALRWDGVDPAAGAGLLKAYQRILRVLADGEEARAMPLLKAGFESALQIAGTPRAEFQRRWGEVFPGEEPLADAVHASARSVRAFVALHHVHSVQNQEPHYRSARFK